MSVWAFVWGCVWNLWLGHSEGEDCAWFLQVLLFLVDRDLIHLEVFYPVLLDYLLLISRCPTFCSKVSILSSRNKLLSLALRDLESLLLYVFLNLEWEVCCLNSLFSLISGWQAYQGGDRWQVWFICGQPGHRFWWGLSTTWWVLRRNPCFFKK